MKKEKIELCLKMIRENMQSQRWWLREFCESKGKVKLFSRNAIIRNQRDINLGLKLLIEEANK